MKTGCHAIFFLHRINLVPRGYIILDGNTVSTKFRAIRPKIGGNFQFTKILSPRILDENARILRCERMETIIHFRKNMMTQPS